MDRWKLLITLVALLCPGVVLVGSAQVQLTIDATKQPSGPARGRGPFPGSTTPGHSAGLPIRLELLIPTSELRSDGTILVDFIITNVGIKPIVLPSDPHWGDLVPKAPNTEYALDCLTLYLTSDGIKDQYFRDQKTRRLVKAEVVGTSAELYGRNAARVNDFETGAHGI